MPTHRAVCRRRRPCTSSCRGSAGGGCPRPHETRSGLAPSRRREFCHSADALSLSLLKHLRKGEGVAAERQSRRRLEGPTGTWRGRLDLTCPPCVVRDANMGHHSAGGHHSWCPELEVWTTHPPTAHSPLAACLSGPSAPTAGAVQPPSPAVVGLATPITTQLALPAAHGSRAGAGGGGTSHVVSSRPGWPNQPWL